MPATAKGRLTRDLISILGASKARALINAFRGQRLYVPHPPIAAEHPIAAAIGLEDAHRLIDQYRGCIVIMPSGKDFARADRDKRILAARAAGASVATLSHDYDLSHRMIYQILERGRMRA